MATPSSAHIGKWGPLAIAASFLFVLYVPSSINGSYSTPLWSLILCLAGMVAIALCCRRNGIASSFCIINSILLITVILVASVLSPFTEYRWGGLLPFAVLALIYVVNMQDLSAGRALRTALTVANVNNVAVGTAVVLHNASVDKLLVNNYTTFYPELVSSMVEIGKPVLSFGSHSTAAFFFYLLFLMNLETYATLSKVSYLFFAFSCIFLGFALFSVTGIVLMSVAVVQTILLLAKKKRKSLVWAVAILAMIVGFLAERYASQIEIATDAVVLAEQAAATSQVNGFSGRFSELGTLFSTVRYIKDRPFTPVGIGYRSDLFFGDSGPVEYYLRGSVFLVCSVYGGLFSFLKRNLLSKRYFVILLSGIMAFEVGFSSLVYVRSLCLLPILVVYFNDLARHDMSYCCLTVPPSERRP